MARQRMLHPGFFRDSKLLTLSPLHRLLYEGLWGVADREGRLRDSPMDLKIELLPADHCDVDAMLTDLARIGRIVRYVVGGERYIFIVRFKKYQHPHKTERPSVIPPPPAGIQVQNGEDGISTPADNGALTVISADNGYGSDSRPERHGEDVVTVGVGGGGSRAESESESESVIEDLPAHDRAGQGTQGELIHLPPPPKKLRELSLQQRAKAYFDGARSKKTPYSDEVFDPREINAILKDPLEEFGRVAFAQMIDGFMADQRHAEKNWPFRLFVKIHRSYFQAPASKPRVVQNANDFKRVTSLEDVEKIHRGS